MKNLFFIAIFAIVFSGCFYQKSGIVLNPYINNKNLNSHQNYKEISFIKYVVDNRRDKKAVFLNGDNLNKDIFLESDLEIWFKDALIKELKSNDIIYNLEKLSIGLTINKFHINITPDEDKNLNAIGEIFVEIKKNSVTTTKRILKNIIELADAKDVLNLKLILEDLAKNLVKQVVENIK
ncbi:hypothetical protein F1B92_01000 [Campylobacter sp. FMV-PI01]|uniref:Lipoprotein n=1 Tax=Campylobacter portucalensis TaxID=2608384 RepID=A0A6L5WID6_9BACT|nr:hypothetical protein [Campylobacter portucalensis]MSN95785.1 hypothetical protein [Campylobacter portucalensis]